MKYQVSLLCENMIPSHMEITCYLHMRKDHHCYGYMINNFVPFTAKNIKVKWFGI